jgi:hypothetical protein
MSENIMCHMLWYMYLRIWTAGLTIKLHPVRAVERGSPGPPSHERRVMTYPLCVYIQNQMRSIIGLPR